ncbi:MAG: hypothetical protein KTR25_14500 [Myxococcales bacterium]|nr:hypothetical protein [Myxococcales bacterium]
MPDGGFPVFLAFILFPLVTRFLFRQYSLPAATILSVVIAEMYLPSGEDALFDFPMVPPLGKAQWSAVIIIYFIYQRHWKSLRKIRPLRGLELLPMVLLVGWFGTWKENTEPLIYGLYAYETPDISLTVLPAITLYDIISEWIREIIHLIIPFLIGRAAFQRKSDITAMCTIIVAAGLVYIPIMFLDMRLGPIVHSSVYGYYPHEDISQTIRWGGFRPQGFMLHGLVLARYQLVAFICAVALYNSGLRTIWSLNANMVLRTMMVVVVFGKSMGAIIFLIVLGPLLFFTSIKTQAKTILVTAILVLGYPYVRAFKLLDIDTVVGVVAKYSPQRAQSLGYRFRNENELSSRAREKIWFGWGGYARGHIWDKWLGVNLSTVDGYWVGRFNMTGIFGLVAPFVLMLFPVIRIARNYKKLPNRNDQRFMIAFSVVPLIYAVECIPNAIFTNLPFITAGAAWQVFSNMTNPKIIAAEKHQQQMGPNYYPPPLHPPHPPSLPHPKIPTRGRRS